MTTLDRPEPVEDYTIGQEAVPTIGPTTDEDVVVPVRIVESGQAAEVRDHRLYSVPVVPGVTGAVAGGDQARRRLYILNTHSVDSVVLLDEPAQSVFTGFVLPAGESVECYSEVQVYAALPSGGANTVTLSVVDEFSVGEL